MDRQEMLVLVLVLVVLQFEGTRGGELHLHHRAGEDVVLPCNSSSFSSSCSDVTWFHNRNKTQNTQQEVWNGKVVQSSSRAYRLNMDRSCSLIIHDIDPGDSGLYICRSGSSSDGFVYLNVLSINRGEPVDMYYRGGDEAVLPCNRPSSSDSCSAVDWFHKRNENINIQQEVHRGIVQSSPRSARMSLDRNCSLIINNINADDAGWYRCSYNTDVFLNLLIISPSPPDADPAKEDFTVHCSLSRSVGWSRGQRNSFRWLDETGTELTGEGVGLLLTRPRTWNSSLTVQHQSGTNRSFTCQFVEGNCMKVDARYPPGFIGTRKQSVQIYHRAGDVAVLPCRKTSSSCSTVNWLHERAKDMKSQQEVQEGIIVQNSSRAARLSLDNKSSLIINNITAEDAGHYSCQLWEGGSHDVDVYLNIMSISSSPPGSDPTKNGDVTLRCSLSPCAVKSLLWVDETGSELTGEGDGYKSGGQFGCFSRLTVNLQSSRRFTCQFIEGNKVKIEAHYQHEGPPASSPLSFIMLTLKITGLILMVGLTVGIIRTRGRKKPQKDIKVRFAVDDPVSEERSAAAALRSSSSHQLQSI
ncbi:PREDICTED: obscurin-like [Poecilia mexicana]|uniref:obscurin-like n=1 Tax=Poecilia mexicana TaxID=48701 RepID=UPI00072EEA6D|nr:PREDICTED: obscurin-like [Poecilia mexicana]